MAAAFSHVIFDLDGTILNTLEDLAAAGNHTCEAHGWPTFAVDEYRYKVGNGMLKLVERFMPAEYAGDGRMFEQTLAEFRAYYGEHKEDHTAPYAGTIEMLDRLRAAGVQLAVLTNKDHVSAAPLIEKYFGSERFALVQGRIDAFPPKPEAPVTLHVMEELGANPATTLYVGDSNVDVLTGHNAGLKSAGVSWGFRGRAELEAAGADYVVDTQNELAALILGEQRATLLNAAATILPRGKRIPFWSSGMGCAFRLRRIRETASRFRAIFRVALSATNPIRKPRPTIRPKTGSRFPKHSMQRCHKECPQLPPGHLRTSPMTTSAAPWGRRR